VNVNGDGSLTNPSKNLYFEGCVIRNACRLENAENVCFTKCIFNSKIGNSVGNLFENNVFMCYLNSGEYLFNKSSNDNQAGGNMIRNNVIVTRGSYSNEYNISNTSGNNYYNNIFSVTGSYVSLGSNYVTSGNYYSVARDSIFVNQTGENFNYSHDYHLQKPEVYLGTDDTQVGLYGSMFPYKEGGIPSNPHFQEENIAPTSSGGQLNVQIKAAAQDY
jgi:hypothetical protein